MDKIRELINRIGNDGILHFLISFALCALLANYVNIGLAFFIPVFIGFGKEILWDAWMGRGQFQWKDLLCDIAGSLAAALLTVPSMFIV